MTDDIKGFALSERWTLETADHATVFVQYRGVDVVAIWTPLDDATAKGSVTIPSVAQIYEMRDEALHDRDPQTQWAAGDEIAIELASLCGEVDRLREDIDRFNAEEQQYPTEDWQYEVANGDTRLGYHDWVARKVGRR